MEKKCHNTAGLPSGLNVEKTLFRAFIGKLSRIQKSQYIAN